MKEVRHTVGMRFKTILCSIRAFSTKSLSICLTQTMIGYINLGLKMEGVETNKVPNRLEKSVETRIGVNAWWQQEIAMVVEKTAIR